MNMDRRFRTDITSEQRSMLVDWVASLGVNPNDVPSDSQFSIDDTLGCFRVATFEVMLRNLSGHIMIGSNDSTVKGRITVPLAAPAPEWLDEVSVDV